MSESRTTPGQSSSRRVMGCRLPRPQLLLTIAAVLLLARLTTLGLSDYGPVHGFNEAYYSDIASNYNENILEPVYDDGDEERPFYDTPPLTTYSIWASQKIVGQDEFGSRLPSWISLVAACAGAGVLAARFVGGRGGALAVALAASSPWMLAWGGRAQTDMHLAAAATWFVVSILYRDRKWAPYVMFASTFLGLFAKQVFVLVFAQVALGFVAFFTEHRKHVLKFVRIVRVPILSAITIHLSWWLWQWSLNPDDVIQSFLFHLNERSAPFENYLLVLSSGIIVAGGATLLAFRHRQSWKLNLVMPALLILAFSLYSAPAGHQYYTLPAFPFLAAQAAIGLSEAPLPRGAVLAAIAASALVSAGYVASMGDFGGDSVKATAEAFPDDEVVRTPNYLTPALRFYSGQETMKVDEKHPDPNGWIVTTKKEPTCRAVSEEHGYGRPTIRLYDCTEASSA